MVGGEGSNDVEVYSPGGECNELLRPIPTSMSEFWRPVLAYLDDKILACAGKNCWSYDVISNNWDKITSSVFPHDYRPGNML